MGMQCNTHTHAYMHAHHSISSISDSIGGTGMYISTEFLGIADDTAESFEAFVLNQTQKDP